MGVDFQSIIVHIYCINKTRHFYLQGTQLDHNVPAFMFGGAALLVAVSVLFSPETSKLKKLPESIEEAANLQ